MRYNILILSVAATVLAGCHSPAMAHRNAPTPAVAAPPPSQPLFITTLGTTTTSPDGVWRVVVSPRGDAVDITDTDSPLGPPFKASSTISVPGPTADAPGWRAHPGWFVFIENASRVWVYDGDRYLFLETASLLTPSPTGGNLRFTVYIAPGSFPCAVPAPVFSRLSEAAQKPIKNHGYGA